ncbi:Ferric reductase [Balamuthia mandrillaris]
MVLRRAGWWLAVAAVGTCLAVGASVGLGVWSKADWFTDPGPYSHTWTGYNKQQFVGLVFFTFLSPVAFTLLFTASQQALCFLTPANKYIRLIATALAVSLLVVGATFGGLWAAPFLDCFGVGCLNPEVYKKLTPRQPEAGMGWQAIVGMSALLAFVSLAVAQLASFVLGIVAERRQASNKEREDLPLLRKGTSTSLLVVSPPTPGATLRQGWLLYFLLFLPLLVFGFTTTYIPNSWEYFMPDRIASYAAQKVTHDPKVYKYPEYVAIPEYPWATFKTKELELRDDWRLKIFPDNLFLYVFLLVVPLATLFLRSFGPTRLLLGAGVWLPQLEFFYWHFPRYILQLSVRLLPAGESSSKLEASRPSLRLRQHLVFVSLGRLLLAAATVTLITLWFWYWVHDHNFNGYWPSAAHVYDAEKIGRAFGQLAVLLFGLLMFPAARNSVLPFIFGLSWEAAIFAHVILGRLFLLAAFAHMVANYVWYSKTHNFPGDVLAVPMHLSNGIDNFTVPLITLVTWLTFITMGVLTLWQIRRRFFELFYYSHHITYCLLIPAVLWHAAAGWEFLLPGVAFWFVDRCIRAYRSATAAEIISAIHHDLGGVGRVVSLRLRAPFAYRPGHYCFINVSQLSLFQWHPFTIAGADKNEVELHIKVMGEATFTSRLADAVRDGLTLTVNVDGPYGLPIEFGRYQQICLVAGGIGITPCKAIIEALAALPQAHLPHLERVVLVWSARDRKLLDLLYPAMAKAAANDKRFALYCHFTGHDNVSMNSSVTSVSFAEEDVGGCPVFVGRPNLSDIDELHEGDDLGLSTLMFACGPENLVADAERHARQRRWDFHNETFLL